MQNSEETEEIIEEKVTGRTGRLVFSFRMMQTICLVYLAALGGAEYINHYISGMGGIILHTIILLGLIVLAVQSRKRSQRGLWLALGLAPLIRIISIALPVMLEISQTIWYIAVSIPILAGVITASRTLKYSYDDVGINWTDPLMQIMVATGGFCLGILGFVFLRPVALINTLTLQSILFPALVLLLFTGFVEELAFRGVMQKATGVLGSYGWILIAAVYGLLQIQQGSIYYCLFAFGSGLFLGYIVKYTGSIIGVSLAHGLINIGLYLIFPFIF